jgi:hypothetical protein
MPSKKAPLNDKSNRWSLILREGNPSNRTKLSRTARVGSRRAIEKGSDGVM